MAGSKTSTQRRNVRTPLDCTIHPTGVAPRRKRGAALQRFSLYRDGMRVQEYLDQGGMSWDIWYDTMFGYIELKNPDGTEFVRPAHWSRVHGRKPAGLSLFEMVRAFHEKFDLAYDGPPRNLDERTVAFRHRFALEERHEYAAAVQNGDLVGALDGLVDEVYVALGTAYLHGFDFDEAFRRVHEANMKKKRATAAEQSTRSSTQDVIKPSGWQPPDLSDLVRVPKLTLVKSDD